MIKNYNENMKVVEDVKDDDMTDEDMKNKYDAYLNKIIQETDENNLEKIAYNKYLEDVEKLESLGKIEYKKYKESERLERFKNLGNSTNL